MDNAFIAPGEAALIKLRSREPFAAILAYDEAARQTALATALEGLERGGAYVVRIANPLRTPLTIERILIQLAGFRSEPLETEDTDRLMRALIARLHTGRERLVLSVEQADTLHPLALILLDQIARPLAPGGPAPQVLLVGTPAFARILGHPLLARMRSVLGMGTPDASPPPEVNPASHMAAMAPGPVPVPTPPKTGLQGAGLPGAGLPGSGLPGSLPPESVLPAQAALEPPEPLEPPAPPEPVVAVTPVRLRAVAGPDVATRPPLTAHEARLAPTRPRWGLVLAGIVLVLAALIAGLYAALRFHVLPPGLEAAIASVFDSVLAWVLAGVLALRTRLLSSAGML